MFNVRRDPISTPPGLLLSVLRDKGHSFAQDGLKKMIAAAPLFRETLRSNRQEREGGMRPNILHRDSKLRGRFQLLRRSVADQA